MFLMKSDHLKTNVLTAIFIALTFLWSGSAYLSWVYHLRTFCSAVQVDLYSEVAGYLFQAAGVLIYLLSRRTAQKTSFRFSSMFIPIICGLLLACLARFSASAPVALIFGFGMNLMFGMIAAGYLQLISFSCTRDRYGIVFGSGYGAGSILSYLLSLPAGQSYLTKPSVFPVYGLIVCASIFTAARLAHICEDDPYVPADSRSHDESAGAVLTASVLMIILLSCVNSAGAYFPISSVDSSRISLELSRSFYAVGLVAAGFISDRKRSVGAILCIAALCFPFFSVTAGAHAGVSALLRTGGYIFFGFYSVYRVLLFLDLADSKRSLMLAPLGILFGRIGDALGALLGIVLSGRSVLLISVMACLFVVCIFLFFWLYQRLYIPPAASRQNQIHTLASDYNLSSRETQMLEQVLSGSTNKEIAKHLFISENTVKFHMHNLLKKTGCANRTALIDLFENSRR